MSKISNWAPNSVAFLRVVFTFVFLYFFIRFMQSPSNLSNAVFAFGLYAFILGSDVLDGAVARFLKSNSPWVGIVDISADFFFIFTSTFFLSQNGLLFSWFPWLVVYKFLEYIAIYLFFNHLSFTNFRILERELIGRIALFLMYLLPAVSALLFFVPAVSVRSIMDICSISAAGLLAVSSVIRLYQCLLAFMMARRA